VATKKSAKKKVSKKKTVKKTAPAAEPIQLEAKSELVYQDPQGMQHQITSPEFTKFEIAKRIAHTLSASNLVPDAYRGRPNDIFVAINMGSELGLEPFQAIQSIAVIEGKPCLYGDGLIGVVRASPKCLWIEETRGALVS